MFRRAAGKTCVLGRVYHQALECSETKRGFDDLNNTSAYSTSLGEFLGFLALLPKNCPQ